MTSGTPEHKRQFVQCHDEEQLRIQAELLSYDLVDQLAAEDVSHLWHPDSEEQGRRLRQAVSDMVVQGDTTDHARQAVYYQLGEERATADHVVSTLYLMGVPLPTAEPHESEAALDVLKRDILVTTQLNPMLGEPWRRTIAGLFGDMGIDFEDGRHLPDTVQGVMGQFEMANHGTFLRLHIGQILVADRTIEDLDADDVQLMQLLIRRFVMAKLNPSSKPLTHDFLQTMLRGEMITVQQHTELKALLD